jgi:hypothetical protein
VLAGVFGVFGFRTRYFSVPDTLRSFLVWDERQKGQKRYAMSFGFDPKNISYRSNSFERDFVCWTSEM